MRLNNIEELKRLEAKRTQGEWTISLPSTETGIFQLDQSPFEGKDEINAAYIAHSANMMPRLLKLVETAQKFLVAYHTKGDAPWVSAHLEREIEEALEELK